MIMLNYVNMLQFSLVFFIYLLLLLLFVNNYIDLYLCCELLIYFI